MKNNTKNTQKETGSGAPWEDSSFAWDQMQDGIFDKIKEQDPTFFGKERERRPVWLFWVLGLLLIGGLVFYIFSPTEDSEIDTVKLQDAVAKNNTGNEPKDQSFADADKSNSSTIERKGSEYTPGNKMAAQSFGQKGSTVSQSITQKVQAESSQKNLKNDLNKDNLSVSEDRIEPLDKESNKGLKNDEFIDNSVSEADEKGIKDLPFTNASNPSAKYPIQNDQFPRNDDQKSFLPITIMSARPLKGIVHIADLPNLHLLSPTLTYSTKESRSNRNWTYSMSGGIVWSSFNYKGNSPSAELLNQNTKPYIGFRMGIDARAPLGKKSYLQIGLEQEQGYEYLDVAFQREVEVTKENVLLSVTHYLVGKRSVSHFGDTTVMGIEKTTLKQYNTFSSSRINLGWATAFDFGSWELRPNIGLKVGWLKQNSGRTVTDDFSMRKYSASNPIYTRWQFMTHTGIEIERRLNERLGLFMGYQYSKQWNNASLQPNLSLRPAFHSCSLGLSYRW